MGKGSRLTQLLKGNIVGKTKPEITMETKLRKIAALSSQDENKEFVCLMPHFNKGNLICCFNQLDGKKAVGVDGKTKDDYALELDANIETLISTMVSVRRTPYCL